MGHSYNTPLQDTLVRHSLGRCLSNTPVGHFIKHLYGTFRSYFCGKQALNITVGSAPSNPPTTQIDMSHALSISLVAAVPLGEAKTTNIKWCQVLRLPRTLTGHDLRNLTKQCPPLSMQNLRLLCGCYANWILFTQQFQNMWLAKKRKTRRIKPGSE